VGRGFSRHLLIQALIKEMYFMSVNIFLFFKINTLCAFSYLNKLSLSEFVLVGR